MKWSRLIGNHRNIAIIGGGGKTGLIEALEKDLCAQARPALATVTTRLGPWQLPHLARVQAANIAEAKAAVRRAAAGQRLLLAGPADKGEEAKLAGVPVNWFSELRAEAGAELVFLIEADGSAGRPLKAHRDYEPLLPPLNCYTIAVLGLSVLRENWSRAVHRPEILWAALGPPPADAPLSPAQVAAFVNKCWRPLRPDLIFLNQLDALTGHNEKAAAEKLAGLLKADGWHLALGSLRENRLLL